MTEAELKTMSEDALTSLRVELGKSRASIADAAKKQEITDAMAQIALLLVEMSQASLLQAAMNVGKAAGTVDSILATVPQGSLGMAFKGVVDALNRLGDARGEIHKKDALPKSEPPASPPPAPTPAPAGIPQTSTAKDFATLQPEYDSFFGMCTVRPERKGNIAYYVNSVVAGKARYMEAVAGTSIPWYFVGIIHGMEGGFSFNGHLHNGDSLQARTVHEPIGFPKSGNPPFTWLVSAKDALKLKGFDQIVNWTDAQMLFQFERYNGMGYRPFKLPSPYLWSFSNLFLRGKYVSDGKYDPNAPSEQCGAGVILKAGKNSGVFV